MKTLKEVRESLGKSREQIAVECHVTAATVRNWETAATEPNGRAKDFVRMCGAYGLTLEGLVKAINATQQRQQDADEFNEMLKEDYFRYEDITS